MSIVELQQRMLAAHKAVVIAESRIRAHAGERDLSPGQTDQLEALICEWEQLGQALTTWCMNTLEEQASPAEPACEVEEAVGVQEGSSYEEPETPEE